MCWSWGLDSGVLPTWFHASSSVSRYSSQTTKPSRTGWHPPQWKSNPIIAGAQSIPNLRATRFKPGTATMYKYPQKHTVTTWMMHPYGNNSGMLTSFNYLWRPHILRNEYSGHKLSVSSFSTICVQNILWVTLQMNADTYVSPHAEVSYIRGLEL